MVCSETVLDSLSLLFQHTLCGCELGGGLLHSSLQHYKGSLVSLFPLTLSSGRCSFHIPHPWPHAHAHTHTHIPMHMHPPYAHAHPPCTCTPPHAHAHPPCTCTHTCHGSRSGAWTGCPHPEDASHAPRHLGFVWERQCLRLLRGSPPLGWL